MELAQSHSPDLTTMSGAHGKQRNLPLLPVFKCVIIHFTDFFIGEICPLTMRKSLASKAHESVGDHAPIAQSSYYNRCLGWFFTFHIGTVQIGNVQIGTAQIGTAQTGTAQTGTVQTGLS